MNNDIDKNELLKDIKTYKDIKVLSTSDGGKVILAALVTDIISAMTAMGHYKDLSHIELVALASKLTHCLSIYKVFTGAETSERALRKIFDEAFKTETEPDA